MTPKEEQECEQALTTLSEVWPPMFRRFYVNLLAEGFNEVESMDILRTIIRTLFQPSRNQI